MSELAPCPFCKSDLYLEFVGEHTDETAWVQCNNCGFSMPEAADEFFAKEQWDKVASPPPIGTRYRNEDGEVVAVVVPLDPNEAMLRKSTWSGNGDVSISEEWARKVVYQRMLAAIPEPKEGV